MAAKDQTGKRGFAAMDPEKQKEIARHGGQTSQRLGKGHSFTLVEAREAGKKGGDAISRDRAHMAEISRKEVTTRRRQAEAKSHHGKE